MLTEQELADIRERCHQAGLGYERPDANQYHKDVKALLAERDRLLAGQLTEVEFQGMCHNFTADNRERFERGCREYQNQSFGTASAVPEANR